jgi:hypothetical protein
MRAGAAIREHAGAMEGARMTWKLVAAGIVALTVIGCGDDGGGGGSGGQGTTSSTGGGGQGTTTGTGGGGQGGGADCGGFAGTECGPDEYCDYGDDTCGNDDGVGTCKPRPLGCPDVYIPACACDGTVYGNPCDANAAGQDVSNAGGCAAPAGTFACGFTFCASDQQYCQRSTSDVGGYPDGYACQSLPASCVPGQLDCQCLANEPCGTICEALPSGDLQLTCPGG